MKFYVTFGTKYAREDHPTLPREMCNPYGVLVIEAPTHEMARNIVSGLTSNHYAFIYDWPAEDDEEALASLDEFYPEGVNATITLT